MEQAQTKFELVLSHQGRTGRQSLGQYFNAVVDVEAFTLQQRNEALAYAVEQHCRSLVTAAIASAEKKGKEFDAAQAAEVAAQVIADLRSGARSFLPGNDVIRGKVALPFGVMDEFCRLHRQYRLGQGKVKTPWEAMPESQRATARAAIQAFVLDYPKVGRGIEPQECWALLGAEDAEAFFVARHKMVQQARIAAAQNEQTGQVDEDFEGI